MSKIKRSYFEKFLYGVNYEILSSNKTITNTDYSKHILDPNGSARDVTFTGNFIIGDSIIVRNDGTSNYNLTVTNTSTIIHSKESIEFCWTGSVWKVISNEYDEEGLFDVDENGDMSPVSSINSDSNFELDGNDNIMPKN